MTLAQPVIVLAPDSFKGSLDAPAVCAAMAVGLQRVWPDAVIHARPMADGGEGTLDAVLAACGASALRAQATVRGAAGEAVVADHGIVDRDGQRTAVVEVAQVVGITDAGAMDVPVTRRDTRGVGELLRVLLDAGLRHFMIGLGGSSTNDGGAGLLCALGLLLRDAQGSAVEPTPEGLAALAQVDASALDPRLAECTITLMSDVNNPFCGERGATAIFGPQKGVAATQVPVIDAVLARYGALAEAAVGRKVATNPGAGAAGGMGFALQLIGSEFRSGAAVVADLIGLDAALEGADWAFTGEGRSDTQTLLAKAPFVVAQRAAAKGVPITLLSGAVDPAALPALGRHFAGAFALPGGPTSLADCIAQTAALLADRAEQIARVCAGARATDRR